MADDSGVDAAAPECCPSCGQAPRPSNGWPLVAVPPGVVLIDAATLAELQTALQVERAFANSVEDGLG